VGLTDGDLGNSHSNHGGDAGAGQAIVAGHCLVGCVGDLCPRDLSIGHRVDPGYGSDPVCCKA